jgi:diguanylate cyclase (GGDEF)-like protein
MTQSIPEGALGATGAPSTTPAFSCALTATLIARVKRLAGDDGLRTLLSAPQCTSSLEYLADIGNWISMEETLALWRAGEQITRDPNFARHVGEDAVRVLGSSSTATTLRALGSPEELLRLVNVSSHRFSIAANLETTEARPGYAEIHATAAPGFVRERLHCDWTTGMLSQSTALFGLPPARVEHDACQALGAPECVYKVSWDPGATGEEADAAQVSILRKQLDAMTERLQSVFETAADLIATGDLNETLVRITDRAAQQVRAPKYLLAVHPTADGELLFHQKGFGEDEALAVANRILTEDASDLPEHWCAAPVRSHRKDYGQLVAVFQPGAKFFPQERELLELYARYAATALDSATALLEARMRQDEAQRRHEEARTLLDLARRLAEAGTSDTVASRLADAVPGVIDCDRVAVYLWNEELGTLERKAVNATDDPDANTRKGRLDVVHPDDVPQLARWLERPDPEPFFIDIESSPVREALLEVGAVAAVAVPIATVSRFLGCLIVSVRRSPGRLHPRPELGDRLSGVAAHAVTALENGRLVDHITHQARHDRLTGLSNRLAFGEELAEVTGRTRESENPIALFYVDLDGFKVVNDEFGHEFGDTLLREVAARLLNCVRAEDIVARLGGDEFAILVDADGDPKALSAVSKRLAHAFDAPFEIEGHTLPIRASVGRAVWPVEVEELGVLLRHADAAMYDVKRARQRGAGLASSASR